MGSTTGKLLGAALGLAAFLPAAGAWAQADTPPAADTAAPDTACGFKLGAPALREWRLLDGKDGRLGCPTADEAPAAPSPQGSASREIVFGDKGAIFTYLSGPLTGKAVAIADCYRLYFQFGGATGWLGLPLGDAQNTNDGQKQAYEGGEMRFGRALDSCDATPTGETPGT